MDLQSAIRHALVWLLLATLPLVAMTGVRLPRLGFPATASGAAASGATTVGRHGPSRQQSVVADVGVRNEHLARLPDLPAAPLPDAPWFQSVQEQLRQLGADYVRLEKWHSEPAVYYFECHVGPEIVDAGPDATARLASLSVSPQAATQDVIRRVQQLTRRQRRAATRTDQADRSRYIPNSR